MMFFAAAIFVRVGRSMSNWYDLVRPPRLSACAQEIWQNMNLWVLAVGHAGALGGLYVLGFYFNRPPSIHWNYTDRRFKHRILFLFNFRFLIFPMLVFTYKPVT